MEEALGKLDISEEEATPLVIDDTDDDAAPKWLLAGKVRTAIFSTSRLSPTPYVQHGETLGAWFFVHWGKICSLRSLNPREIGIASGKDPHGTSASTQ